MTYEDLNEEQRDIVEAMVTYCLNNGIGLGQCEGWQLVDFDLPDDNRKALSEWVGLAE